MTETLANSLVEFFTNEISGGFAFKNELIIFLISLLPVLELRGGLIAASLLHVKLIPAMIICFIGNILPIPFILLFIKKIFAFMKRHGILVKFVEWLEKRGTEKGEEVKNSKWEKWGLLAFVAIPLPGTGGWTGALVASLLNMKIKDSFPVIACGVAIAGIIMAILSYGLLGVLGIV